MARARITKTAVSRLFDAAATPIYVVDQRRRLIYGNPAGRMGWVYLATSGLVHVVITVSVPKRTPCRWHWQD